MKTQKKEMLSVRKLVGLSFGFAAALCALEYGKPLLGEREPVGSSEEIAWIEADELEIIRVPLPDPPKIQPQPNPQPQVQTAVIVPDIIDIVSDKLEIPDLTDFLPSDDSEFFLPEQVDEPDTPVLIPEEMPEFPGGEDALFKFLRDEIRYPKLAKDNKIEGKVYVKFVVGKDGLIREETIEILRSPHASLSEEAKDAVMKMPKWKPGKQRLRKVSVYYVLPVNFELN